MGKRYEYENLTTRILRVPVYRTRPAKGKNPPRKVRDRSATLVFGSANDRTLPPGTERGPRCPSPIVVVTEEQIAALEPAGREFLQSCVNEKWLRCRELAA